MTDGDWFDAALQTLGMFLAGDELRARGPRGEPLGDDSFLLCLHSGAVAVEVTLPEDAVVAVVRGRARHRTTRCPAPNAIDAQAVLRLEPRTCLLLRAAG